MDAEKADAIRNTVVAHHSINVLIMNSAPLYSLLAMHSYIVDCFLLSIRLSSIFLVTPIFSVAQLPVVVRVSLVMVLALALAFGIEPQNQSRLQLDSFAEVVFAVASEVSLGIVLSLGVLIAFGSISVAGRLLDIQIGFGIGQVYDPISRQELPILTTTFNQLAIVLFLTLNGHHALLRGLALSLQHFPLGRAWPLSATYVVIARQISALFSLGFSLAAPIVFCIFLIELALGVVARNLPQMNIFAMGTPLKICVGLAALAIWHASLGGMMSRIYASIYAGWGDLFDLPVVAGGL